ncbi:MAG: hypothetical protein LWX11_01060 [Firmicutes bacterium]|nr:hypothetical protein [Bacillota bacterium]
MSDPKRSLLGLRIFGVAMSLLLLGLGLQAYLTEFTPQRSTRFGLKGPFYGADAKAQGLLLMMLALLPLIVLLRTPRQIAIFGTVIGLTFMGTLMAFSCARKPPNVCFLQQGNAPPH